MNPCVLFVVDGLRPDAVAAAPMPTLLSLAQGKAFAGTAQSVMPNCTLPCHFTIFHSVMPERHGITSNVWTPQVRPVPGLFEVLHGQGKKVGFAYNWEQLRDLGRPGHVERSFFVNMDVPNSDWLVAQSAAEFLREGVDFLFCYLGDTDEVGHKHGWMSPQYLQAAANADKAIAHVLKALPEDGSALIVADHGGHDRTHGTNCPEDMTVPLFIRAPHHTAVTTEGFQFHMRSIEVGDTVYRLSGEESPRPDLLDVAPTLATLCGVTAPEQWEGKSLVQKRNDSYREHGGA